MLRTVSGWRDRKSASRGVSQRLPKVGNVAIDSALSERAAPMARTINSSDCASSRRTSGRNRCPRIGKHHPLADALEQEHAQLAFEILDLPAHRALGQVQLCARLGEAAVARRAFEGLQRRNVRDQPSRQPHSALA